MKGFLRNVLPAMVLALWVPIAAPESFTVSDIEVEGLQRVSAGNVFGALPVEIGDRVNNSLLSESVRTLFRTGLFSDVSLARDGDVLIVEVEERPSISEIEVEGNENIETEQLMEGDAPGGRRGRADLPAGYPRASRA
jgi:Outer membrane protein/protective antigen OMA87